MGIRENAPTYMMMLSCAVYRYHRRLTRVQTPVLYSNIFAQSCLPAAFSNGIQNPALKRVYLTPIYETMVDLLPYHSGRSGLEQTMFDLDNLGVAFTGNIKCNKRVLQ